jgi:hypothetical protein
MATKMFVLLDTETNEYLGPSYHTTPTIQFARIYQRKSAAIERAGVENVPRNVPKGRTPDHKYSNRPQVVVLELDLNFSVIATHTAPPRYIYL